MVCRENRLDQTLERGHSMSTACLLQMDREMNNYEFTQEKWQIVPENPSLAAHLLLRVHDPTFCQVPFFRKVRA
jgi:hypothetical protein